MDQSSFRFLLLLFIILLILLLLILFACAPILTSLLLSLIYTTYVYLSDANSQFHKAQEYENRFTTIFSMLFMTLITFTKDSPFAIGLWSQSLGFLSVIGVGFMVNIYDRHIHRSHITKQHASVPIPIGTGSREHLKGSSLSPSSSSPLVQNDLIVSRSSNSSAGVSPSHYQHLRNNDSFNNHNNNHAATMHSPTSSNSTDRQQYQLRYHSNYGDDVSTISTFTNYTLETALSFPSRQNQFLLKRSGSSSVSNKSYQQQHNTNNIEHYKSLIREINKALQAIDAMIVPSTIQKLYRRKYILDQEKVILHILGGVAGHGLNYIIPRVKLALIFYKIKDHSSSYQNQNRTALIELLAIKRLAVLNVVSRVFLLHALQSLKLSANARSEYWVRNIFLKTSGAQLSLLKTLMDSRGDYHNMTKLLYKDLRSEDVRDDILSHFANQATEMLNEVSTKMNQKADNSAVTVSGVNSSSGESSSASLMKSKTVVFRKILSDVDDTLLCSGGIWPAGIDRRFPRKALYPGVTTFYKYMDINPNPPGNIAFLSARPHLYKDWAESHSFEKFKKMKESGRLHCMPTLLAGDVESGKDYLKTMNYEPLAVKKFRNFVEYESIYPEFKHVFIGDNGQGDLKAALYMMSAYPTQVEAVYIHLLKPVNETHGYDEWFGAKVSTEPTVIDKGSVDDAASVTSVTSRSSLTRMVSSLQTPPSTPKSLGVTTTPVPKTPVPPLPELDSLVSAKSRPPLHFFSTYVDAALHATKIELIWPKDLFRLCNEAVDDFYRIEKWPREDMKILRGLELNVDLWFADQYIKGLPLGDKETIKTLLRSKIIEDEDKSISLVSQGSSSESHDGSKIVDLSVKFVEFERKYKAGDVVTTIFGNARVLEGYDSRWDIYEVELDWRPLDKQVSDKLETKKEYKPIDKEKETIEDGHTATSSTTIITSDRHGRLAANRSDEGEYDVISNLRCVTPDIYCSLDENITVPAATPTPAEHVVNASLQGRMLKSYVPAAISSTSKSLFRSLSFFPKDSKRKESIVQEVGLIEKGSMVTSPYGIGEVVKTDEDSTDVIDGERTIVVKLQYGVLYTNKTSLKLVSY